jgi:hypothetical protein
VIQVQHRFRLGEARGTGVACGEDGLFVGETPLIEKARAGDSVQRWRPRAAAELDRDLSRVYGLPVTLAGRMSGLAAVAQALDDGDLARAQITALYLKLPDPPAPSPSRRVDPATDETLYRALEASSLLKLEWDESKHPRWPAGSPDGVGGEFAPAGAAGAGTSSAGTSAGEPKARLTSTQGLTIPMDIPLEEPLVRPLPTEILPPPLIGPIPRNPYPERPECVKEWNEADEYCRKLAKRGLLGKHPYQGHGNSYEQCMRGQISEDCGGNPVI